MHSDREVTSGHPADFRVRYRFYTKKEGGRQGIVPYQGYRGDFWYEHDEERKGQLFGIHPEFEDENQNVVMHNDRSVTREGTARMWVNFAEMRPYHIKNLKVGAKGYFMEGNHRVAECTVIEILALSMNPFTEKAAKALFKG